MDDPIFNSLNLTADYAAIVLSGAGELAWAAGHADDTHDGPLREYGLRKRRPWPLNLSPLSRSYCPILIDQTLCHQASLAGLTEGLHATRVWHVSNRGPVVPQADTRNVTRGFGVLSVAEWNRNNIIAQ